MANILVIKLRYLGDVLLATPVLRALRERFPQARLTMAVNRGTEEIVRWNPDLDEVLIVERGSLVAQCRLLARIRRHRFDCVLDLTDGDRSAILARFSGAPIRVGFNEERRWRGVLYTKTVSAPPGAHRVERDLQAVRAIGIDPKACQPVLQISQEDQERADHLLGELGLLRDHRPLVMFHPGARYWFKAWPVERFAELADRLADACPCHILVGGAEQDLQTAEAIRQRARAPVSVLAGRLTLLEFAAVLRRCALFIGNDNGPMHMAAAIGTPVVALFGPSNPAEWGPRSEKAAVLYKGLDCRQCFHPACERGEQNCMRQIAVEEVLEAGTKLLISGVR